MVDDCHAGYAIHAIRQALPSVEHVLYADDRSFTARNASEIVQVTQLWSQWTSKLGLRENLGKAQYWHQTVAGQRNCRKLGVLTVASEQI